MAKPPANAKLSLFERFSRFSMHALEAHPETGGRAALASGSLYQIKAYRRELKRADNLILAARAAVAYWDVRLDATIKAVGAAARAAEANDVRVKLLGVLFGNKTPSEVIKPTGVGLGREVADAKSILNAFDILPTLAAESVLALADRLRADIEGAQAAVDRLEQALAHRELIARKKPALKQEVRDAFDRLEGQLLDQFPGQRDLVASFFLPSDLLRAAGDDDDVDEDDDADEAEGGVGGAAASAKK